MEIIHRYQTFHLPDQRNLSNERSLPPGVHISNIPLEKLPLKIVSSISCIFFSDCLSLTSDIAMVFHSRLLSVIDRRPSLIRWAATVPRLD